MIVGGISGAFDRNLNTAEVTQIRSPCWDGAACPAGSDQLPTGCVGPWTTPDGPRGCRQAGGPLPVRPRDPGRSDVRMRTNRPGSSSTPRPRAGRSRPLQARKHPEPTQQPVVGAGEDPRLSSILAGRYRLVRPIRRGSITRTYLVEHTRLHETFAVELLASSLALDPRASGYATQKIFVVPNRPLVLRVVMVPQLSPTPTQLLVQSAEPDGALEPGAGTQTNR